MIRCFAKKIGFAIDEKEEIIFVYEPKPEYTQRMLSTETHEVIIISLLVLLFSIPIAFLLSLLPSRLSEKLLLSTANLQRQLDVIDENTLISETDLDGKITYISSKFLDFTGYSKDEMIGKTHAMLRDPDTHERLYVDMWQNITKGNAWTGVFKNFTKDKKRFTLKRP